MSDTPQRNGATEPPDAVRPSWSRSGRPFARRVVKPLQAFLETETSSAFLLLCATVLALLWANSPLGEGYQQLWSTELGIGVGRWDIAMDLADWIAQGLMSLFFLVVGLEIKRELLTGELRDRRVALLPVAAALGGILVPVAIYLAFTAGTDAAAGFGIAMPTDVVFALGVVALAGSVPPAAKALLLALAIVDDLVSIVVVAFAYSGGVELPVLLGALGFLAAYGLLWRIHVRALVVYVALGLCAWVALFEAGVSPTLVGVALAFLTPSVPFQRPRAVSGEARRVADQTLDDPEPPDADAAEWLYLSRLSREAVSPLARAEAFFLPWSSYLVVPLFALSHAGIELSSGAVAEAATSRVGLGILVSRIVGKPVGIALAVLLVVRLRSASLPPGLGRRQVVALGAAASIPFTVSMFVGAIALPSELVAAATVAILLAALVGGGMGFVLLRRAGRRSQPDPAD